jgi:hypothetical protein
MRRLRPTLAILAVVALAGCTTGTKDVGTQAPGNTGVATASPSAAASPSPLVTEAPTPTLAPTPGAQTLFGSFDLNAMKQRYGSTFTTATVEGGRMRYVTNIGGVAVEGVGIVEGVEIDFMVDPNDPTKALIQTSVAISDITAPTAAETGAINAWFSDLQGSQPDAVTWIRGHYSDYLQAPGAELSITQSFGPVGAGFYTMVPGPPFLAGAPATIVGFYVEDSSALGR